MSLWIPPSAYERQNVRMGSIHIHDCSGDEPNYQEAKHLHKTLVDYDECLQMRWVTHDKRWIVNRKGLDGSQVIVRTIEEPDGSYRTPDARTLRDLQFHDMRGRRGKEVMSDLLGGAERKREAEKARAKAEMVGEHAELILEKVADKGFTAKQEVESLATRLRNADRDRKRYAA